ncbi:hypothetical protein HDV00_006650 [Rhizophlyctis rosea]|nr:hypothetical protein HDV00_006650 [Rhizophlyctis rosea]
MNNARYNQTIDLARADWVLAIMGDPFMRRHWIAVVGTTCFFKKDLKMGQKFVVRTRLLSYGPKWIYIQHLFVTKSDSKSPVVHCMAISKCVFKKRSGKTVPMEDAMVAVGYAQKDEGDDVKARRTELREKGWKIVKGLVEAEENFEEVVGWTATKRS